MVKKIRRDEFVEFFKSPDRVKLKELLKKKIGETDNLDFKKQWTENSKIAKHVLAMSNSGGGVIVFGVEDGTNEPIGLDDLKDKKKIHDAISGYLPKEVTWDVFDFNYTETEYESLKGKKFQVIYIVDNPKLVPFVSLKKGTNVDPDTVYVRRGTSSVKANHDELQSLINKRIDSGYSSEHILKFSEHIDQLNALYKAQESREINRTFGEFGSILAGKDCFGDYDKFISDLIKRKKNIIEKVLKLE